MIKGFIIGIIVSIIVLIVYDYAYDRGYRNGVIIQYGCIRYDGKDIPDSKKVWRYDDVQRCFKGE